MSRCCTARGYEAMFGDSTARRDGRRYRKKGLDKTARRMVDFIVEQGVEDATVLEIGGGIGAIQLELLRAGAARAVNVELSPAYEETAAELIREAGMEGRIERRVLEFPHGDGVQSADVVVLHRVVCCYPDFEALLGAAADRAGRLLVLSFPPDNAIARLVVRLANAFFRLRGWEFRTYAHPIASLLAVPAGRGLRRTFAHSGRIWRVAGLERP